MNRTQRAKIRQAHEELDGAREIKSYILERHLLHHCPEELREEKDICRRYQKALRRQKRYCGSIGGFTVQSYKELMGA